MKKWIIAISILIILPISVYANSAAPYQLPDQSAIYFDSETGIKLDHETINVIVDSDLIETHYHVAYQFSNTLDDDINVSIWFITNSYKKSFFEVRIDGVHLETESKSLNADSIGNWSTDVKPKFVTPKNALPIDEGYNSYHNYNNIDIEVEEFILSIKSKDSANVIVEYTSENGYFRDDDYFSNLKTQIYYLSPASFYEGDASVDIQIEMPPSTLIGSNIEFDEVSDNIYMIKNYTIGEENLYLTFLDKDDLFFGTNSRMQYYKYLSIFLGILAILAYVFRRKKWHKRLLIGLIVLGILTIFARPTYGMLIMLLLASPLIAVVVFILLIKFIYKHRKRRKLQ